QTGAQRLRHAARPLRSPASLPTCRRLGSYELLRFGPHLSLEGAEFPDNFTLVIFDTDVPDVNA
ncbi:MAG: hypothetical protein J7459_16225, partial [Chloroflexus sp.]|nr:hypothetical protein [Chloroflexus sp.]